MFCSINAGQPVPIPVITSLGFSDDTAIMRFGPSQRNLYIIHYVTKGKGYYNGNAVIKGQGFLITPHQQEEYYPDEYDPWACLWIISEDPKMGELFKYYMADETTKIFNYNFIEAAKKTVKEISEQNKPMPTQSEISEIFLRLFNHHFAENKYVSDLSSSILYYDFAVNFIRTNLHFPVTVKELTEKIGISQPYLYKIFLKRAKKSPKQYIDDMKISAAKEMLTETDLTIDQIAQSLGYMNYQTFSKLFSLKENISPQSFRKQKKSENNFSYLDE